MCVIFWGLLPVCLTVSAKHPILCVMRVGNTCGFQVLHKGLVKIGRLYGTASQNGLKQKKVIMVLVTVTKWSSLPFIEDIKKYINYTHSC